MRYESDSDRLEVVLGPMFIESGEPCRTNFAGSGSQSLLWIVTHEEVRVTRVMGIPGV